MVEMMGKIPAVSEQAGSGALHLEAPAPAAPLQDQARLHHVVMGAGPGGLLTALLLAQAGKEVAVFEMRERPTNFYGSFPVVLNTRGLQALSKAGTDIIARIKSIARPVDSIGIMSKNKTVANTPTYGMCIMRDQAMALLLKEVEALGVPIHWQHKLVQVDMNDKKITLERGGESISLFVDGCLVGTDGNYSKVRRECEEKAGLKVEMQEWGLTMRFVKAPNPSTPLPAEVDGSCHYVLGSDGYVCQHPDGTWSMSYGVQESNPDADIVNASEATPENVAALRRVMEKQAAVFLKHVFTDDQILKGFFDSKAFNGHILRCSTLAPTDWIALAGDAAHAVAPYTGEGINSSLESASILGTILAKNGTAKDYAAARDADARAAYEFATRNKALIAGNASQKCASTFTMAIVGLLKKRGCVRGTIRDFTLGQMASTEDRVWRYSELVELDNQQRKCLYPTGQLCFPICCRCCGKCD